MPTINWTTEAEFGANDNFQSTVLANLNAATAGSYAFRITSDDGSKLSIDGAVVIDHDGLHGDTSKEGTVTLTAGTHALRIDYIEAGGGQVLKLEWKAPGASDYVVVPTSVLSTEAGVVRVTAPGSKYCEGATDTAGDGLRLDTVNPDYDLTNLRPPGFEPHVSGMDFLPDGRMVLTTSGDVSSGGWVPNPDSGEVYLLDHVTGATSAAQVTYKLVADKLRNPMGIQVIGDKYYVSEREPAHRAVARHQRRRPDGEEAARDVAQRRQLPRVRLRPDPRRRLLLRRPLQRHQQRRRDHRSAAGHGPGHVHQDQPRDLAGLDRRGRPAHAQRRRLRPRGRHLRQRQPGCLAAGEQDGPDQAGPLLQPLHQPARPARHQAGHAARPVDAAQRDRQLARRTRS